MPNSIFSRYAQGENRVTATLLAVLERLGAETTEALLSSAVEGGDEKLQLVRYRNQPMGSGAGVPDAQIRSSVNLLFETKVALGAVNRNQLVRHLASLDDGSEVQRLYLVTPDSVEPPAIGGLNDHRIRWVSFAGIYQAIDEFIATEGLVISERDEFLMRQFQVFLDEEGLSKARDDVLVVPAKNAYPEYLKYSAYVCQPGRSFRNVEYMAFYRKKCIEKEVPKVVHIQDNVEFSEETVASFRQSADVFERTIAELIELQMRDLPRPSGEILKIMLLTAHDDPRTIHLREVVPHDGSTAWVQGQRYVRRDQLIEARSTADLG